MELRKTYCMFILDFDWRFEENSFSFVEGKEDILSALSSVKKRPGAARQRRRLVKYDGFTLSCIRRQIHGFFCKNEIPTLSKVLKEINDDAEIFSKNISRSRTLKTILKGSHIHFGAHGRVYYWFTFEKRKREGLCFLKDDIILWRRNYLRKIRELREKNAPIYYLDETWVNEGHSETRVWQDTTIKSSYEASSSNLTVGLTAPKGKGRRLIINHIGSKEGFVRDVADTFIGKNLGTIP
ncbi:uncharacterized protein TNCV_4582311 [Trichonephila clavipes]|nr:uncharacterized protein TNCV_4582311 [Trichonephila clavipes]